MTSPPPSCPRDTVPPQTENAPLPPKGGSPQTPHETALRAVPKPNRVGAVIDALRAEGMTGTLTPRDTRAIKDVHHDPGEVAALYAAIFNGEYGDAWMQDNLSVALCLEKLPGWRSHQAGHTAPARKNGRPLSGVAAVEAVFAREGIDLGHAGHHHGGGTGSRGRRTDPGVGHEEARGGVPRQLRG